MISFSLLITVKQSLFSVFKHIDLVFFMLILSPIFLEASVNTNGGFLHTSLAARLQEDIGTI